MRILGLKSSLKLHKKKKYGTLIQDKQNLNIVGNEKYLEMEKSNGSKYYPSER